MTYCYVFFFFFFKQKTAYEMRISDWSSDVCSSDLSETVAMRLHAAGNQIHLRQRAIGAAAVLHQLALADHRHEALGQRLLLRELAELERADQLIERQRSFMRGERIEDQIAARNRIR